MLIGVPPILGPELLFALRSMGHGDEIALVDGNFPAQETARRLVRMDGAGLLELLEAVLSVLPLDTDVPNAIFRAAPGNDPDLTSPFHAEIDALCRRMGKWIALPLAAPLLYPRVALCHTVVATSELSLFANVILRKGVVVAHQDRPTGL